RTAALSADPTTEAHHRSPVRDRVSQSRRGGFCFHVRLIRPGGCPMRAIKMVDGIDQHRRRFVGAAAMAAAVTQLGMVGSAAAQSSAKPAAPAIKPGMNGSFGMLK